MESISVLGLRRRLPAILRQLQSTRKSIRLTYRGKPVADLTPVSTPRSRPQKDDPFYRLAEVGAAGPSMTNQEMDRVLYGGAKGVR